MRVRMLWSAVLCAWSLATVAQDTALTNIAQGAPYVMEPAPSYGHCTEPGDATQLTDGVLTKGHFWTQDTTVGWQNAAPVIVTLDLGAVRPIRGVSFNTAAGVAGVEWPTSIEVFVAHEDRQFHDLGNLVRLSAIRGLPPMNGYAVHRFWTEAIQSSARFIALVIFGSPYIFADEIEVYEGDRSFLDIPLPGEAVADVKAFTATALVRSGIERRLAEDLAAVRAKWDTAELPQTERAAILWELESLADEIAVADFRAGEDFRAVLPLNDLHARVFRAQARLWKAAGCPELSVWASPVWGFLPHMQDPPREATVSLAIPMMGGEFRAASFNLTNASQQELRVRVQLDGFPGSPMPVTFRVAAVPWTDTAGGRPVAAALPDAERGNDGYLVDVPSGMTRQVWLTCHSSGLDPGEYDGTVKLDSGEFSWEVPLRVTVYNLDFPEKTTLHFGGWDYTDGANNRDVTPENRAALIAMLREYFVDSPWATSAVLPHGAHDATGAMTAPPDTSAFDAWVALWPGAAQYLVFAAVGSKYDAWETGTPEFEKAVGDWARFWADHARKSGIDPVQIGLLLVDEPRDPAQDGVIAAWAAPIHAAQTGLRVWEDPIYDDMSQADPSLAAASDVLCPNRTIFRPAPQAYRDYYETARRQGTALEFYSCSGPVRLLAPYTYFRMQAWDCWVYRGEATYFWAFADGAGASSWNEYTLTRNAYTPLFLDAHSVVRGKHMEACREGIEDFEYLTMLRAAVEKGGESEAAKKGRQLLEEAPRRVADAGWGKIQWYAEESDTTLADRTRVEILEALAALAVTP